MKRHRLYFLAAATAALLAFGLSGVAKADVAPPQCYRSSTDSAGHTVYASIDCASSGADNADNLKNDTCYVLRRTGGPDSFTLDVIDCQTVKDSGATAGSSSSDDVNKIYAWIQRGIDFTTGVAGVAIVSGIILGGIQYSTAGANPGATTAAKKRITQSIIALLALFFMYTVLQWLIPGGLFR